MAKERIRARHEQAANQRAQQQRKKRRNAVVARIVGIVAVVAIAGSAGFCIVTQRDLTNAVTTATYAAGMHVGGTIAYKESPPIGGAHNVLWQNCGIYGVPIHSEHAVHSLEHGAIWITYRPDLPADQIARLKTLAADDYMLLSPYPGLTAPVVASAWNHQVVLAGADDVRLTRFIGKYKNNPATTPEFGAACMGGTAVTAEANSLEAPSSAPMRP